MTRTFLPTVLAAAVAAFAAPAQGQEQAPSASEKLAELEVRITRLEDMNDIERVQRAYGYFVDKAQWSQLAELFTDDATLEIGGRGIFVGKDRVLYYMQKSFSDDGAKAGVLINHMQFQPIADISPDGRTGWLRSRAYVMANGGWGLPLYEDEFRKGEDGKWRMSRLTGPFTMYAGWKGWGEEATPNTWPDKFGPPPDLPPSVLYLTYPGYYVVPFHYPNPVTGALFRPDGAEAGAYHHPPGTAEQMEALGVGRTAKGDQPIYTPPKD